MANRIPLIVDTTDGNKIKELPIGSNLDLTGSGIVGTTSIGTTSITADVSVLNSINTNNIIVNASADLGSVENLTINGGTAGQVLSTDGAGNVSFITLGNYDQNLNTTDDVTFNTVGSRRITAPINVTAEIRTSSTGLGNKTWAFGSTGILTLPVDGDIRNSAGQSLLNFTSVPSDIISDVDNTRDLGAVGNRWAQGHFTNMYGALTGNVTGDLTGNVTGNTAGVHTGAVTGNVTGDLTGNVTGNTAGVHTGAVTGSVTGSVTGNVTGDLSGNVTGDLTGNVQGSVFANDSTQMINAVTGKVVGPIQVNVANISILGGSADQVLKTNGAGVLSWVTQSGGPGGGAVVLDDLTDVVITSVSSGQVLKYDGANWINSAVPLNAFGTITVSGSGINIAPDQLNDTLTFIASTGISMNVDAGTDSITITNTAPNVTQNVFTTVAVAGQNNVVADSSTDTLTLVAGANVTITTNDSTDSITINAGQSNSFVSIAVAGQSPVLADSTSDTLTLVGSGITITTDSVTDTITFSNVGTGLESRTTVAGTTASLASLASGDLNITGFKGYALLKIQTSVAAWVRLYTDGASRTADAGRLEAVDPDPGAGVIAEVITTGGQTILMSPGVMGFNNETSPTTTIPCRVTNKSGSTAAVTVTLTLIKIEA
jgi:trimeric autotransporter adhesin